MTIVRLDQVLEIIAHEIRVPIKELQETDELEFLDLGIDELLSQCIRKRIREETGLELPSDLFQVCPTVTSLNDRLVKISSPHSDYISSPAVIERPLSIRLRNSQASPQRNVFLLPDGSGSAMSYAYIPSLGPDVCLYGLNSPFLSDPGKFLPLPDIASIWVAEIRRLQPKGPYILGGWSAGGYYCFEVAKYLLHNETQDGGSPVRVEKLILIDSPCRKVFEALPMAVVTHLSQNGLMGRLGVNEAPQWLLDHFEATITRVAEYKPSPLTLTSEYQSLPEVYLIWATSGVYGSAAAATSGLDMGVKVTKFMLEDRLDFGPNGWESLFPRGTQISSAATPGTHFTVVFPPNSSHLGLLLRDILSNHSTGGDILWDRRSC